MTDADVFATTGESWESISQKTLRAYLSAPFNDFTDLCREFVHAYFYGAKAKITSFVTHGDGWTEAVAQNPDPRTPRPYLFRFSRTADTMGEQVVKDLFRKTKALGANAGICVFAGGFTKEAQDYAYEILGYDGCWYLHLVGHEKLVAYLNMEKMYETEKIGYETRELSKKLWNENGGKPITVKLYSDQYNRSVTVFDLEVSGEEKLAAKRRCTLWLPFKGPDKRWYENDRICGNNPIGGLKQ